MEWRKDLKYNFDNGNYEYSLQLLQNNILKKKDLLDSYINLVYIYVYIISETDISEQIRSNYLERLNLLFKESCMNPDFRNDPDFLFYSAYMASSFGEFYLNLSCSDVKQWFKRSVESDPLNLLYQWGYCPYINEDYIEERREYAVKILNDDRYVEKLKKKSLAGYDLLDILHIESV